MKYSGHIPVRPAISRPKFAPALWLGSGKGKDSEPGAARDSIGTEAGVPAQVLIVEDELLAAWHVEAIIQDLGHVVCGIEARGEDAVRAAAELAPDIVFMDVNLGTGFDGIEAARRIRTSTPIAVVFVTAYGDTTTREKIAAAVPGALILQKPVSPNDIRMAISAQLKAAKN